MEDKRYLTAAEYAALENVSKQRVYQLFNGKLKPFVKELDGVKVIDIKELSEHNIKQVVDKYSSEFEQGLNKDSTEFEQVGTTELDLLKHSLDLLAAQIETKDRLIDELRAENSLKDKHIQEQSKELTRLLEQSQELNRNNQLLLAQKEALEQAKVESEESKLESVVQPVEKVGFWKRLFGG